MLWFLSIGGCLPVPCWFMMTLDKSIFHYIITPKVRQACPQPREARPEQIHALPVTTFSVARASSSCEGFLPPPSILKGKSVNNSRC